VRLMLDVHKKASITACVRAPGEVGELHQEIREFSATTRGLLQLRDWLASFGVTLVGMEATGVYWKPVYYLLEDDFECWLLRTPGISRERPRQEDGCKGCRMDLPVARARACAPELRASQREIRELRNLTRYRKKA
jgi:transposase